MSNSNRIMILIMTLALFPLPVRAEFALPVSNGLITSGVGWRLDPFGSGRLIFHRGTDIAVPVGTPVRATRAGRVIFAGVHGGHGNTVIIAHDNGDRTLYGHNSSVDVLPGRLVEASRIIAHSGNTGRSTGPHVHYELIVGGHRDDVVKQPEIMASQSNSAVSKPGIEQFRRMDDIIESILTKVKENPINSVSNGPGV